jgi:hypothetical protein
LAKKKKTCSVVVWLAESSVLLQADLVFLVKDRKAFSKDKAKIYNSLISQSNSTLICVLAKEKTQTCSKVFVQADFGLGGCEEDLLYKWMEVWPVE